MICLMKIAWKIGDLLAFRLADSFWSCACRSQSFIITISPSEKNESRNELVTLRFNSFLIFWINIRREITVRSKKSFAHRFSFFLYCPMPKTLIIICASKKSNIKPLAEKSTESRFVNICCLICTCLISRAGTTTEKNTFTYLIPPPLLS